MNGDKSPDSLESKEKEDVKHEGSGLPSTVEDESEFQQFVKSAPAPVRGFFNANHAQPRSNARLSSPFRQVVAGTYRQVPGLLA